MPLLLQKDGSRLIRNLELRRATSPWRILGMVWRSSSSCLRFREGIEGPLLGKKIKNRKQPDVGAEKQ